MSNKHKNNKLFVVSNRIIIAAIFVFGSLLSYTRPVAAAAGDTVVVGPSSGISKVGDTFTLSIDGHVGSVFLSGTYSATGTLTFPSSRLSVVDANADGGTFTAASKTLTVDNNAGTIQFNLSNNWWSIINNQDVHLFNVTFKSLSAGTADVNITGFQYQNGSRSATITPGKYTIQSPPKPSPSPTPKPSPKPSTKPTPKPNPKPSTKPVTKPTPKPSPSPSPAPEPSDETDSDSSQVSSDGGLKIENLKITATRQSNSVSWTVSNKDAISEFKYGKNKGSQNSTAKVNKSDDGVYDVNLENLSVGSLYYFTIKAATTDGLAGATYEGTLITRGYPVQLTIQQNNLLIPGSKITIDGREYTSNNNSIVSTELDARKYTASITPQGSTESYSVDFTVKKLDIPGDGNPQLQSFILNIDSTGSSSGSATSLIPMIIGGIIVLGGLISGAIWLLLLLKRRRLESSASLDNDLVSSYGAAYENRGSNTPEPNLTTIAAPPAQQVALPPPPPPAYTEEPSTYQADQMTNEMAAQTYNQAYAAEPQNIQAPNQAIDTPMQQNYGPTDITDNNQYSEPVIQNNESTYTNQYSDQYSQATDTVTQASDTTTQPTDNAGDYNQINTDYQSSEALPEELSSELSKIESTENTNESVDATTPSSDEPSAVYDESTGELSIVHHRPNIHTSRAGV